MENRNKYFYGLIVIVWMVYVFLTFSAPQSQAAIPSQWSFLVKYMNVLRISIALPYLVIWLVALYGSLKLRGYAQTIQGSPDSKGIMWMSHGLLMLLLSLIVPTLLGVLRSYNPDAAVAITIANNYAYALIPLTAFYFFFIGSTELLHNITKHKVSTQKKIVSLIPLVLFSVVYVWLVFTNPNRQTAPLQGTTATYYLPDFLILLTVVSPSIVGWALGILSAVNIKHFMEKTTGVIYKQALKYCVWGIATVITGSIIIQALLSLGTTRLLRMGVGQLLFVIYLFLAIQALGYILIGLGAKKLTRIETA